MGKEWNRSIYQHRWQSKAALTASVWVIRFLLSYQKVRKMVIYYLLQRAQAYQHMLFARTLTEWQTKKLNEAYYQTDHLQNGRKAIRELHKITSIPKKFIRPWLTKREFGKFIYHTQRKFTFNTTRGNSLIWFMCFVTSLKATRANKYKQVLMLHRDTRYQETLRPRRQVKLDLC